MMNKHLGMIFQASIVYVVGTSGAISELFDVPFNFFD
jgi:hypothetical protein